MLEDEEFEDQSDETGPGLLGTGLKKLTRISHPGDPEQCQGHGTHGQCPYKAMPGTTYCARHGGVAQQKKQESTRVHDYRLQTWQARMEHFACSDKVASLAGEIGVLRLILEETLNQCTTSTDLMLNSTRIADLASRIERLIVSFDKISTKGANLLTKGAALNLAGQIVDIISAHVTDSVAIDKISDGIIDMVIKLSGKEVEE